MEVSTNKFSPLGIASEEGGPTEYQGSMSILSANMESSPDQPTTKGRARGVEEEVVDKRVALNNV